MGKKAQKKREIKVQKIQEEKEIIREIQASKNPWMSFWRRFDFWVYTTCLIAFVVYFFIPSISKNIEEKKVLANMPKEAVMETSKGNIVLEFYPEAAPKTVENFAKLSRDGFYNNLTFHRVIKDFMIQGGDPNGDGTGGPGYAFQDEINPRNLGLTDEQIDDLLSEGYTYDYGLNSHKMEVGSLAMANSGPNTNGSQFFIITEEPQPHLDGRHTVFGRVKGGMDVVTAIASVEVDENDMPVEPVTISKIEVKN
jgi:peptidyl-prolyl cis-trans isomerase B (cyclophilin B)